MCISRISKRRVFVSVYLPTSSYRYAAERCQRKHVFMKPESEERKWSLRSAECYNLNFYLFQLFSLVNDHKKKLKENRLKTIKMIWLKFNFFVNKIFWGIKCEKKNKKKCCSRVPRLSDTRYSTGRVKEKLRYFFGIPVEIEKT